MLGLRFCSSIAAITLLIYSAATAFAQTSTRPAQLGHIVCPDAATAENGGIVDEFYMGEAYHHGYCGYKADSAQAVQWYARAADQGYVPAQYTLGEMYFGGEGIPVDYPKAKSYYQKAAEQGHGLSQLRLGFLNAEAHFDGLKPDYAEAEKWFLKAAAQNAGDAQFRLGNFYRNYKNPPDMDNAFLWLTRAAEHGHRVAAFDLGRMYIAGDGTRQDIDKGLSLITDAANHDLLQAQMFLAETYSDGRIVKKDVVKAVTWILKIAAQPTASVAYLNRAGDIFFEGWETMPRNYPSALKYYQRAADKGDPHALLRLSDMYAHGLGVEADPLRAKALAKSIPTQPPPDNSEKSIETPSAATP